MEEEASVTSDAPHVIEEPSFVAEADTAVSPAEAETSAVCDAACVTDDELMCDDKPPPAAATAALRLPPTAACG